MKHKRKRWAFFWLIVFIIYMLLSTFYLLLSNYFYQGSWVVRSIGGFADFDAINFIWTPGWLLGFALGASFGSAGIFVGQAITFSIGAMTILGYFNFSWKDLADGFDN